MRILESFSQNQEILSTPISLESIIKQYGHLLQNDESSHKKQKRKSIDHKKPPLKPTSVAHKTDNLRVSK